MSIVVLAFVSGDRGREFWRGFVAILRLARRPCRPWSGLEGLDGRVYFCSANLDDAIDHVKAVLLRMMT